MNVDKELQNEIIFRAKAYQQKLIQNAILSLTAVGLFILSYLWVLGKDTATILKVGALLAVVDVLTIMIIYKLFCSEVNKIIKNV